MSFDFDYLLTQWPALLDGLWMTLQVSALSIVLSLLIIAALLPLALFGVLGLAAVVLVHEIAEVVVILNGLRAARTHTPQIGS